MNIYLRRQAYPRQIGDELRERIRQFDPRVPVVGLETMNEQIEFLTADRATARQPLREIRRTAALLAIIGLYGVMAYVALPALALVNLVRSQLFRIGPARSVDVHWLGHRSYFCRGPYPPCAQAAA